MKTVNVLINGFNDACNFIKAASAVEGDVTVTKGRYVVNGKYLYLYFHSRRR